MTSALAALLLRESTMVVRDTPLRYTPLPALLATESTARIEVQSIRTFCWTYDKATRTPIDFVVANETSMSRHRV
jgi:hypothetical protein